MAGPATVQSPAPDPLSTSVGRSARHPANCRRHVRETAHVTRSPCAHRRLCHACRCRPRPGPAADRGGTLHSRGRPGRRQALRDLPQGQLAAERQCRGAARRRRQGARRRHRPQGRRARLRPGRGVRCQRRARLDRAGPRAAGHQAGPRQRALRPARQCLWRRLDRLRAGADAGRQGRRAGRAVGGADAPLLLAPGHRCAQSQPLAGRRRAGARGPRQAGGRARLPHPRVQGRGGCGPAAPVHPVLRAPGARPGRLVAVLQGRRQGPAGGDRGSAPDLPRRPRPRPALRGAGARRPALRHRREARQDGGACHLRQGPRRFGARHGPRLRAAQPGPAGHPARHRQHRHDQGRGLPHRRPQPGADAAGRRLRQADLVLRHRRPQGAHRRARLCRRDGGGHAPQRGRDHGLPHRRGRPQAAARRLCAGRLRLDQEGGRGLPPGRHAVVHRLRSRPHRPQRRRRHAHLRALACRRHAGRSMPTCA